MKTFICKASWCTVCGKLSDTLHDIDMTKYPYQVVDIDINRDFAEKFSVRSVPVLIKIDDEGKEVARMDTNFTKENIENFLKNEEKELNDPEKTKE